MAKFERSIRKIVEDKRASLGNKVKAFAKNHDFEIALGLLVLVVFLFVVGC